ncbi:MAG: ATP-binding protein [Saprospiraceae bacterium]|nr:ATP-binding protein [Saprospiraceae bacterium]
MYVDDQALLQKIILTAFIVPVALAGLLVGFLVYYQKKKYLHKLETMALQLREQQLLLEKQQAVERERDRIAGEMHDDLGSGLTTIRYLSDRAFHQATGESEKAHILKIAEYSNRLLKNMSEIIWALNLRYDTLGNLMAYLRHYAHEYLEENQIPLRWSQDELPEESKMSGERRRNIHLCVKEALHNLVKHAKASTAEISCILENNQVCLRIADNGCGFDPELNGNRGNGLYNLHRRMAAAGGTASIKTGDTGSVVVLSFPVADASL